MIINLRPLNVCTSNIYRWAGPTTVLDEMAEKSLTYHKIGILYTENHKTMLHLFIYGLVNDALRSSDYITTTLDTIRGNAHHRSTYGRINERICQKFN
jgi:hypothetical protein